MRRIAHLSEVGHLFGTGCRVALHSACASPPRLSAQLVELAASRPPIDIFDVVTIGAPRYLEGIDSGALRLTTFVPGRAVRRALRAGQVTVLREPLSHGPSRVADGTIGADILLLHLSAPDERRDMTLGIACDVMHAMLARRPVVIAEVNPEMPRTSGATTIRPEQVDYWLAGGGTPVTVASVAGDATDRAIADHVAGLIDDGDIVQTGIGSIPDMTLARLIHHRGLGIHTGIMTEAVQRLLEAGVVRGPVVTTLAAGSAEFYRFLHCNLDVEFHPCDQTHDHGRLARIPRLCAINGALEIDLQGRVNAEAADGQIISGTGGQPDFARGATASPGGKSIVVLRATSKDGGTSRIVPVLAPGSPTTIDTGWVDFVVTEHGVARVRGLSGGDLVRELATIAAPGFRNELRRTASQHIR